MQVEIRAYAGLQKYIPGARSGEPLSMELPAECNGYKLLELLNIPIQEAFVFMVNGRRQDASLPLAEGDRIGLFPPVGGG